MMQSRESAGRTQETAAWLLRNLQDRKVQSFVYPTGSGGHVIAAAAVDQWRNTNPEGVAIVITHAAQLVEQWERHKMRAITRMRAGIELKQMGTIMGHEPSRIGLVIIDGMPRDAEKSFAKVLAALSDCTILEMQSG